MSFASALQTFGQRLALESHCIGPSDFDLRLKPFMRGVLLLINHYLYTGLNKTHLYYNNFGVYKQDPFKPISMITRTP